MGEFDLIARLAARLPGGLPAGMVGIGDDAAAVPDGEGFLLLTCDIAVEGRHFSRGGAPMADVGWRVATANVSDIAACGGLPVCALISLGVPAELPPELLDELYRGLGEAAAHYGFHIVGGNISGAGEIMVDCFMTGQTPRFVARKGARPGDLVAVSGTLGDSEAGRVIMGRGARGEAEERLLRRHLRPQARIDLVEPLRRWATAAIDISDSLSSELHHLARAGGVGLAIRREALPLSPELVAFSESRGEEPLERALSGGEDYQLLCTLPPARAASAEEAGLTIIGEVRKKGAVSLSGEPLPSGGWDHLAHGGPGEPLK